MRFVSFSEVAERIRGKTVAVVGSAPSVLENSLGAVDRHEVVVRVNNYKTGERAGFRTDVHYSFYGTSIRKTAAELKKDGVTLCMAKCPNSKPLKSDWHERNNKQIGIDYRYIYSDAAARARNIPKSREGWWFCDTFIPDDEWYLAKFRMLDNHIPTTGFAAILDVLACEPKSVYLTGFDFFSSGLHNVDEKWKAGNPDDPICHRPDLEAKELVKISREKTLIPDKKLAGIFADIRLEPFRK